MVRRRHGWQLPAHTFQVVAITVFFLLAVAFYVFLAPFLWLQSLEMTSLALYSPLALAVFVLYVRSSAIDPADLGVFQPQSRYLEKGSFSEGSAVQTPGGARVPMSPGLFNPAGISSVISSDTKLDLRASSVELSGAALQTKQCDVSLADVCGLFCGWVVKDDNCMNESSVQRPVTEEDVLFCTLCNAEVRKFSKHCRSCDKCVDGFDHHCRWLNNCVGRKNYKTFVSLMATSLTLLVLEWGLGMAVFVRCFVDKRGIEHRIVDKLGNGFSRGPFATVVAICTLVSLLASIPLGELFFFHLILIRKGITTYEYVVAMRVQNEQQGVSAEGDATSVPISPSSSTGTGLSGSSSIGLQYSRGGWCTPPRIFVDHMDEVVPHLGAGQVPSTVDPDAGHTARRNHNQQKKRAIRISAWKLAKLNTDEAIRAAAKARETSSTLRQVEPFELGVGEGEFTPSTNVSSTSSFSGDYTNSKRRARGKSPMVLAQRPPASTSRDDSSVQLEPVESGYQSRSSGGSPSLIGPAPFSPLPAESRYGPSFPTIGRRLPPFMQGTSREAIPRGVVGDSYLRGEMPTPHVLSHSSADFSRAWSGPAPSSDGYEASSGESVDEGPSPGMNTFSSGEGALTEHIILSVDGRRVAIVGNRSSVGHGLHTIGRMKGSKGASSPLNYTTGYRRRWPDPSVSPSSYSNDKPSSDYMHENFSPSQTSTPTSDMSPSLQRPSLAPGNLVYSETSIFFGGPMEQTPSRSNEDRQALPPNPATHTRTRVANPVVASEVKPAGRFTLRSQTPVFAPRVTIPFSLLDSPQQ